MCGIAGIVHIDGSPADGRIVETMCAAQQHRGPDDRGVVARCGRLSGAVSAALGNQRLSIIDIAGGHQPIANEDETIWTVLNGEIYNFVELRQELERHGHRFATRSDTEVIVHAYEQWGDDAVAHLDGMFALAIWDERRERLLLARDRFGKKPLVYFDGDGRLVFASELQALLAAPDIPRAIDRCALQSYLAYMAIPAPQTIYAGVRKLPPAHMLVRDRQGTTTRRYWDLRYLPKLTVSEDEALARVEALLSEAVRKRLVSEVPLGAFLSGGVDSTAVVALMAEQSGRPVQTFSIGFEQAAFNELPYARQAAATLGTEHHELVVRPSAADVVPSLVRHFGEPYADSSAIPTWYLSQMTRRSVTVALNGDGGDEVFAGYGRHMANRLAEQWQGMPVPLRTAAETLARSALASTVAGARATRFAEAARLSRTARYRAWAGVFSPELLREITDVTPADDPAAGYFREAESLDAVDAMLSVDTRFYLPTDLLPKVDITSMAHSLEVRSPLLDTALAEFVAALPTSLKVRRTVTKYLLKRLLKSRVPASVWRRRKQGFAVPVAAWLRGELRQWMTDHLQPSAAAGGGLLSQRGLDQLIAGHLSGAADHAHQLWTLLMLEHWYRAFRPA